MRGELLIETSHTKGVDPQFYELFKSVLDSGDAVNYLSQVSVKIGEIF